MLSMGGAPTDRSYRESHSDAEHGGQPPPAGAIEKVTQMLSMGGAPTDRRYRESHSDVEHGGSPHRPEL